MLTEDIQQVPDDVYNNDNHDGNGLDMDMKRNQ